MKTVLKYLVTFILGLLIGAVTLAVTVTNNDNLNLKLGQYCYSHCRVE